MINETIETRETLPELPGWLAGTQARLLGMRDSLPHAMLLLGPPGIGKTALALRFSNALLCESPTANGDACGQCIACGWFGQGNHPDFRLLAPGADDEAQGKEKVSREIKIGQVRSLANFVAVGGHRGGRKVVMIAPADALNVPAANALLKTLEEPAGDTVFILVSARADGLPATIRSRCVAVPLALPGPADALSWVVARTGATPAEAQAWLAAAAGSPLRAAELAEPTHSAAHRLIVKLVAQIPDISVIQAAEALASVPSSAWLPMLQAWVTDLGRVSAGAVPRRYPEHRQRLERLARSTKLSRIAAMAQWLAGQATAVDHPLNPRLFCEDTLLRYRTLFD